MLIFGSGKRMDLLLMSDSQKKAKEIISIVKIELSIIIIVSLKIKKWV